MSKVVFVTQQLQSFVQLINPHVVSPLLVLQYPVYPIQLTLAEGPIMILKGDVSITFPVTCLL